MKKDEVIGFFSNKFNLLNNTKKSFKPKINLGSKTITIKEDKYNFKEYIINAEAVYKDDQVFYTCIVNLDLHEIRGGAKRPYVQDIEALQKRAEQLGFIFTEFDSHYFDFLLQKKMFDFKISSVDDLKGFEDYIAEHPDYLEKFYDDVETFLKFYHEYKVNIKENFEITNRDIYNNYI